MCLVLRLRLKILLQLRRLSCHGSQSLIAAPWDGAYLSYTNISVDRKYYRVRSVSRLQFLEEA